MKKRDFLSRVSIFKKLMFSSVVVLVCACLIVSSYLIHNTSRLLHENGEKRSDQELNHIANGCVRALTQQYTILQEISSYKLLTDYLESASDTTYEMYMDYMQTITPWLSALNNANQELYVKIYLDADYRSVASLTGGKLDLLKLTPWWSAASRGLSSDCIAFAHTLVNTRFTDALVYYRNVYDPVSGDVKRVITVSQSCEDLRADILVQDSLYYLISAAGQVMTSNQEAAQGLSLPELAQRMSLDESALADDSVVRIDGVQYYVRVKEVNLDSAGLHNGWKVLYLQYYDGIQQDIQSQILQCVQICALVALAALGIALVVSNNITARLKLLMDRIGILASGEFDTRMTIDGSDEISRISEQFDVMRVSIHRLMQAEQRSYQERLEAERNQKELMMNQRDMEYQALRAQINPHYLFNTLESIRMSLLLDQEREGARILRIFAETMRRYMEADRMTTTLEEELLYLHYYIEIQSFRMGDRLEYVEHVEDSLLGEKIPCLILQPLVENAIDHGIDPKVSGGTVVLDIRREGGWMVVQVRDDGVGMDEERLRQVRQQLESLSMGGRHLGLRNINRRLVLLFGEVGSLHIESGEGSGAVITVRFVISNGGDS